MNKFGLILLAAVYLMGCDSEKCADGECKEDQAVEYGASRLLALEPATGELRWLLDFQGEGLDIRHVYPDGQTVSVLVKDSCFPTEKRIFSITVDEGKRTTLVPPAADPQTSFCSDVAAVGVTNFQYINGYCVGIAANSGDLVAVNTVDNTETWRAALGASSHFVFGTVLLAVSEIAVGDQVHFRVQRVQMVDGSVGWYYQQAQRMTPIGANSEFVYLLDTKAFALSTTTGDLAWVHLENWDFDPELDGGVLFGNTLLLKRQRFLESLCVE